MKKILLSLLLSLTLGVGAAWADSYTVEFKTASSNAGGKSITASSKAADVLASGSDYVSSFSNCTNVYDEGMAGMRLGTNNAAGKMTINFSELGQVKPTSITILLSVNTANLELTIGSETVKCPKWDAASNNYVEHKIKNLPEKLESITFEKKAATKGSGFGYIKSIKVEYGAEGPVEVAPVFSTLTANVDDMGTVEVNPADFVTGVDNLSFTSSNPDVATFDIVGTNVNFYAFAAGTVEVTATWSDGAKYKGGEATFNFTVEDPNAMVFKFEKDAYEFAMGGAVDAVLVNNKDLAYNLSSSDPTVAFISPVDGESIWMLKPGTATITATVADGEYAGAKAEYLLTVNPEAVVGAGGTATYDFTTNGYGMTATSDINGPYVTGALSPVGPVTVSISKGTGNGARWWNGSELRVMKNSSFVVTVAEGYNLKSVKYYTGTTEASAKTDNIVYENGKASCTPSDTKTTVIKKIVVEYESATGGRTDHEACGLGFYENAYEAIVNDITLLGKVSYLPGNVDVNVQYMVCDTEGKGTVDVQFDFTEDGDMFVYSEALGNYKLMAYVAPTDKYYPAVVWADLNVVELGTPAELWMHGHFIDRYYDLYQPVAMTKDGDVFTAKGIVIGGNANVTDGDLGCVFTTHVPDGAVAHAPAKRYAAEHTADWAAHTKGYVIDNTGLKKAHEVNAQSDIEPIIAPEGAASYDVKVDFTDATAPKVTLTKVGEITGIESIVADADAEVEYFNLQGIRVDNPEHGVFIRRQGARVSRIAL